MRECGFYCSCCRSCSLDSFFFDVEDFEQVDHDVLEECEREIGSMMEIVLFVSEVEVREIWSSFWHFAVDHPSPCACHHSLLVVVVKLCGRMIVDLEVQYGGRRDVRDDYS